MACFDFVLDQRGLFFQQLSGPVEDGNLVAFGIDLNEINAMGVLSVLREELVVCGE